MSDRKPWFLVMRPEDANRPDSQWARVGASRGKVVALPIAKEGWIALAVFIAALTIVPLVIWLGLFLSGRISIAGAVVATLIAVAIIVVSFVMLVRARMTRLPPSA